MRHKSFKLHNDNRHQDGFSLLEVLVALAIMSLATMALFQSFSQLSAVSEKAIRSSEKSLDRFSQENLYSQLITRITTDWDGDDNYVFSGTDKQIRSTTSISLYEAAPTLLPLEIVIVNIDTNKARIDIILGDDTFTGIEFEARNPRFSYLGWDQNWHATWPLEEVPSTGYFDDSIYAEQPQLPLAIKVMQEDPNPELFVMAKIHQSLVTPFDGEALLGLIP